MKLKYLSFILGILFLISLVSADTLYVDNGLYGGGIPASYMMSNAYMTQTFTPSSDFNVTYIEFPFLVFNETGTDQIHVYIYDMSNNLLTTATSGNIDSSFNYDYFYNSNPYFAQLIMTPYTFSSGTQYRLKINSTLVGDSEVHSSFNGFVSSYSGSERFNNSVWNSTSHDYYWVDGNASKFLFGLYGGNYVTNVSNVSNDSGSYVMNISTDIVNLNDTSKGLLPDVYYGLTTFFSNNFIILFGFFAVIFIVLVVLAVAYQIKNIITKI